MPTYDYQCKACGHVFERFQSMTARPIRKCPLCKKLKAQRLIGMGAGVIFKGSGFYETDYRSESYKKAAENDKPPASEGSGGEAKDKSTAGRTKSASADRAAETISPADKNGKS